MCIRDRSGRYRSRKAVRKHQIVILRYRTVRSSRYLDRHTGCQEVGDVRARANRPQQPGRQDQRPVQKSRNADSTENRREIGLILRSFAYNINFSDINFCINKIYSD